MTWSDSPSSTRRRATGAAPGRSLLLTAAGDKEGQARSQRAFHDIIASALALGGTVTGEHGVGLLKRSGLRDQVGEPVLEMHRAVKAALDPYGILNPGKVVPAPAARA